MENQEFWQFTDQLRLQNNNFANLSISDSIWTPKRFEERRNFDSRLLGGGAGAGADSSSPAVPRPKASSDFNPFNDGWKTHLGLTSGLAKGFNDYGGKSNGAAPGSPLFNKSINDQPSSPLLPPYKAPDRNFNNGVFAREKEQLFVKGPNKKGGKYGNNVKHGDNGDFKKNYSSGKNSGGGNNNNNNNNGNNNHQSQAVDKRFKTLPPSEALPRSEAVGGYIFVCNNDTMQENLRRQLFGLPPRYRDSVRAITPGLPLFLYNYSTHQLHGIFEAASFGGTNIDPTAWEDKKCPGESRFPAQVRVVTRNICEPLEEDSFRPILHHYDGPKFRLELSVPEALALLDIFAAEYNQ